MKQQVLSGVESVRGATQFATVAIALLLGACGDAQSAGGAGAGQAAGGAAAGGGISGVPLAGAGGAGVAGNLGAGLSGAAGGFLFPAGGSSATAGSGATLGGSTTLLGVYCESDADCGTGLICLRSGATELNGGDPAGGLCSALCANDTNCAKVEAGAGCFAFGQQGYCLEACTPGDAPDATRKCHGRPDSVCAPIDAEAFCLPMCRGDAECDAGHFCDRANGRCVQTKPVGDPVGAPCDPTATLTTCLATCLRTSADGVSPVTGVCVEMCSAGAGCMYDDAGSQPAGLCVGQLSDPFGPLDLGYCLPSCSCSSECPIFGNKCRAWTSTDTDIKNFLGKPGLCFDTTDGSTELICK